MIFWVALGVSYLASMLFGAFNVVLGVLVVVGQMLFVWLVLGRIFSSVLPWKFRSILRTYGLRMAFGVALVATLGSLTYSEIVGLTPCKYCYWQRIFMFPQAIMLGIASWKQHTMIRVYGITLSVIGAGIAIYHYMMQHAVVPEGDCGAVGQNAHGCGSIFVDVFGYITIPMMALTAFLLIIMLLLYQRD